MSDTRNVLVISHVISAFFTMGIPHNGKMTCDVPWRVIAFLQTLHQPAPRRSLGLGLHHKANLLWATGVLGWHGGGLQSGPPSGIQRHSASEPTAALLTLLTASCCNHLAYYFSSSSPASLRWQTTSVLTLTGHLRSLGWRAMTFRWPLLSPWCFPSPLGGKTYKAAKW